MVTFANSSRCGYLVDQIISVGEDEIDQTSFLANSVTGAFLLVLGLEGILCCLQNLAGRVLVTVVALHILPVNFWVVEVPHQEDVGLLCFGYQGVDLFIIFWSTVRASVGQVTV